MWNAAQSEDDPAEALVRCSTWAAPALSTRPGDRDQLAYLRKIAGPSSRAFAGGEIGFVISIRDPYAWMASLARFREWVRAGGVFPEAGAALVERECRMVNFPNLLWVLR